MIIPILQNHDHTKAIGTMTADDGGLVLEFLPGVNITKEMLFDILSGAGISVLEIEHGPHSVVFIRKARILEFSLCAVPPAEPTPTRVKLGKMVSARCRHGKLTSEHCGICDQI